MFITATQPLTRMPTASIILHTDENKFKFSSILKDSFWPLSMSAASSQSCRCAESRSVTASIYTKARWTLPMFLFRVLCITSGTGITLAVPLYSTLGWFNNVRQLPRFNIKLLIRTSWLFLSDDIQVVRETLFMTWLLSKRMLLSPRLGRSHFCPLIVSSTGCARKKQEYARRIKYQHMFKTIWN